MSSGLVNKFLKASFWSASEQIVFLVLSVIQLGVTSRILTPIDFGVYAIAMFFSTLGSTAFSMGLGPALIQKQGDISGYLNTTWTISFIVAVVSSFILAILCPFICNFYYDSPESVWPSLVMLSSIILSATTNPKIVLFIKELNFKKQFLLRVLPRLFSFVLVIFFAFIFESYWGLIVAILCESIFRFIYSYTIIPYCPRFDFDKAKFRLTALNDEAVSVAASIQQQRLERAKLLIDHEMIYDLHRVESYAREELDMQRPRGEQLQYLDTELPDRVTLYPEHKGIFTEGGKSLLDSIGSCFQ